MTRIRASLSLIVVLLASSLFATGCSTKPADASPVLSPHHTSVYFIVDRPKGFVAYVPEGSVYVGVKIQPNLTEPYVEVPKQMRNDRWAGRLKGEYVAWGLGGTLYVRDLGQLKSLILTRTERE